MVNINPIHSNDEILPDNQQVNPSVTPPPQLTQNLQQSTESNILVEPDNIPSSNDSLPRPLVVSTTNTTPIQSQQVVDNNLQSDTQPSTTKPDASNIYPSPLTFDERSNLSLENDSIINNGNTPFSALIVAAITMLCALYATYNMISDIITDDRVSSFSLGIFDYSNIFGIIFSIIYVLQLIAIIYASIKLWKGSMAALAFLTGVSFLYLYIFVMTAILGVYYLTKVSSSTYSGYGVQDQKVPIEYYLVIITGVVYLGAMIDCWVRGRKKLI